MMMDCVCVGNTTIDDVVLPDGTTIMETSGGDAIYAGLAASHWSNRVGLLAPVGIDFPKKNIELLRQREFALQGLIPKDYPSLHNWVVYEFDGRRTWIPRNTEDMFYELSPLYSDVPAEYKTAKSFLVLAVDLRATEDILPKLKQNTSAIIGYDPQEDYITGNKERVLSLLKYVDIFLPSREEVCRLLGTDDNYAAAKKFAEWGPEVVVVKLDNEGALVYDHIAKRFMEIPIFPVDPIDSTGAGDSFSGAFMSKFIQSRDLSLAACAGAASASIAIEGFGTKSLFESTRRQAELRFETLRKKVERVY
jgi:sugar/nucleoside kinase (ribokinase family)